MLSLPRDIIVTSTSEIKISTVTDTLEQYFPGSDFAIEGVKVPSGVGEQPIGQETIDGALNRLARAMELGDDAIRAYISIENGLFKIAERPEGLNLSTTFDPSADYEDRAVVAISLPDRLTFVHMSPPEDAVPFPTEAVRVAHDAPGGFRVHTAGSALYALGRVHDKQNPHIDLTQGRLSRQTQMGHTLLDALAQLDA